MDWSALACLSCSSFICNSFAKALPLGESSAKDRSGAGMVVGMLVVLWFYGFKALWFYSFMVLSFMVYAFMVSRFQKLAKLPFHVLRKIMISYP